mmetsp:Transcript_27712/g.42977  ORF Transcript_27712/g.42977 Transcript_27712/m.42977 type:complete len:607 (+) Transcript_27712:2-1822(+)
MYNTTFFRFRVHYLIVHMATMLADGLQGTHLYVLYESYGYSVASLYSLGFLSGALTASFTGPVVDYIGRRNSALLYCLLEIFINTLELYDSLCGLVVSRMIGGITTNLLFTVFESWFITEHRKRNFCENKLEIIMRDSVIVSNLSAIASGCIAHVLAGKYGNVGPFKGAVVLTFVALLLVTSWEENYGSNKSEERRMIDYMREAFQTISSDSKIYRIGIIQGLTEGALQTFVFLWSPTLRHFASLQSNTDGAGNDSWWIVDGEPAYGLIFGAYMACGALGGLLEPTARKWVSYMVSKSKVISTPVSCDDPTAVSGKEEASAATENATKHSESDLCTLPRAIHVGSMDRMPSITLSELSEVLVEKAEWSDSDISEHFTVLSDEDSITHALAPTLELPASSSSCADAIQSPADVDATSNGVICTNTVEYSLDEREERPGGIELLTATSYAICAGLLAVPMIMGDKSNAFSVSLWSFFIYEVVVGIYLPCDGVLRSIYMPNESMCSVHTMLRVIVNVAVAAGVISTNFISFTSAFACCSSALIMASALQLSLVDEKEWLVLKQKFVPDMSRSEEYDKVGNKYMPASLEGEVVPPVSTDRNENLRRRKIR